VKVFNDSSPNNIRVAIRMGGLTQFYSYLTIVMMLSSNLVLAKEVCSGQMRAIHSHKLFTVGVVYRWHQVGVWSHGAPDFPAMKQWLWWKTFWLNEEHKHSTFLKTEEHTLDERRQDANVKP
jgi:hypothetical protein